KDQWTAQKWQPFLQGDIWTVQILPGLAGTLKAAAIAAVLALAFGVVFGLARLSGRWWIRVPAGTIVEFFRAIPLLLLIFFASYAPGALTNFTWNPTALQAVVFGLTMYNGSVLAEIVRAGINAVPKGQSAAGYAIGLRKGQLMRLILVPQYYSRGFPVCGRAAAQRDVLAAWWCYIRSPPSGRRWLPGPGGDQPGVVVMPAGGGLVQPSPEGPAKREGKAGAGDQRGGVLPGEDGEPGGFGDGQLDGRDAGRAGLAAAAGNG